MRQAPPEPSAAAADDGPPRRAGGRRRISIVAVVVLVAAIGAIAAYDNRPRPAQADASPVTGCTMQVGAKTFGGTLGGTCWAVYFGALSNEPLSFAMFIGGPPGGYGTVDFEPDAGSAPLAGAGFTLDATLSDGEKVEGEVLVLGPRTTKVVERAADGTSTNLPIASVAGWRVTAVVGDKARISSLDALDASGGLLARLSGSALWS